MTASLTIVVPSYQRRSNLETLLRSLAEATAEPTDGDVDVLVLLDGSDDGSDVLVDELAPGFPVPLRSVWQPNRGLAAARNAGIAAATGELVWLLDDDIVANRPALLCHLHHPRDTARVLMGPYDVCSDDPDVLRAFWWYEERHRRLAAVGVVTDPNDSAFANTSAPTELLREFPFDEEFRGYGLEDFELAIRLLDHGEVLAFDTGAAVAHLLTPSRAEFLRKMREEGVNRMRFLTLHPTYEDMVFRPDAGRVERSLRRASRLPSSTGLWWLARAIEATASLGPLRAQRQRLLGYAELTANYSGVASERSRARR